MRIHKDCICKCTPEKQKRIVTVSGLPDICDYCRKAILKETQKPIKQK